MKLIDIAIRNKVAKQTNDEPYICGNSDYAVNFDFDAEWDAFPTKTARFIKREDGSYVDVVFQGNQCQVPILTNTWGFNVGVFAGDLRTTTAAYISAKKSILCGSGFPMEPEKDVYMQIMDLLNDMTKRIETLEQGGVKPNNTTAILGVSLLGSMKLA